MLGRSALKKEERYDAVFLDLDDSEGARIGWLRDAHRKNQEAPLARKPHRDLNIWEVMPHPPHEPATTGTEQGHKTSRKEVSVPVSLSQRPSPVQSFLQSSLEAALLPNSDAMYAPMHVAVMSVVTRSAQEPG